MAPFVARPSFVIDGRAHSAGTAFALETADRSSLLVLTALHIFDLPAAQLAEKVVQMDLLDPKTNSTLGTTRTTLTDTSAFPMRQFAGSYDASGDVAIFLAAREVGLRPLRLAPDLPSVREKVWLAAFLAGDTDASLSEGVVLEVKASCLYIQIPSLKSERLRATSGAPWVNSKGEVVGLNIGSGDHPNLGLYAFVNPSNALAKRIEAATRH